VVPKPQIIEQTVKISQDFDAFYRLPAAPENTQDLLVITVDAKGIVMRLEDLRPATRKAAEKREDSHGARLSPGDKHGMGFVQKNSVYTNWFRIYQGSFRFERFKARYQGTPVVQSFPSLNPFSKGNNEISHSGIPNARPGAPLQHN
jgi:hypothetical protein